MADMLDPYRRSPIPYGSGTIPVHARTTPLPGQHSSGAYTSSPVQLWTGRWAQAKALQQMYEGDWTTYWRWYRSWRQELSDPIDWWRSNEVAPTIFKIIETAVPRSVLALFGSPDYFSVRGTESSDELQELAIQTLLRVKLEQMKVIPTAIECLR